MIPPFHLAFPIRDIKETRKFYTETLGCKEGRSAERWIDFDFYGHQISAHLCDAPANANKGPTNEVDGKQVPVPHFGLIMEWNDWHALADRLKKANISFIIEPYIRFRDLSGEQATMFFLDPSGNAIEIKSFKDMSKVFAAQ